MFRFFGLYFFFVWALYSRQIIIGTGGVGGIYYPTGQNICKILNEKASGIECNAVSTKGSVYNINGIKQGLFEFAIAQSDTIFSAYNGIGTFKGKPFKKIRTVMTIYPELFTFIVRKAANIKMIHDIKGKIISIGVKGSGTRDTAEMLFRAAKPLSKDIIKSIKELDAQQSQEALKEGKIDGYFTVTGHPSSQIKELAQSTDIDIISISPQSCLALKGILIKNPFFTLSKIPANTYRGVNKDVESFGVKATLITSADTDYKTVYTLIKTVMTNFEEFKKMHPAYSNITKKDVIKGLGAPLHPAARDYFKKMGIF